MYFPEALPRVDIGVGDLGHSAWPCLEGEASVFWFRRNFVGKKRGVKEVSESPEKG